MSFVPTGAIMANEISFCAFELYPSAHIDLVENLCESFKGSHFYGFVSPLHEPEPESDQHIGDSTKPHYHVSLETNKRQTLKGVLDDLHMLGIFPANDFILILRGFEDYKRYCRYLIHKTVRSHHKQQWPLGTEPVALNQPQAEYRRLYDTTDYFLTIMQDVLDYSPSDSREFLSVVISSHPEYAEKCFSQIANWQYFFKT